MDVTTPILDLQIPTLPVRRFTVAEYHKMIALNILGEDDRVELLHGLIVPKMARNPPHDSVLGIADETVRRQLPASWKVRIQCAITTSDSEPEPDLAVVRGPLSRYGQSHPQGKDAGLIIEIADTSLEIVRYEKGAIFAAAQISHYWIINVVERVVEVYSSPTPTGYRQRIDFHVATEVPLILDGQTIGAVSVAELFEGL